MIDIHLLRQTDIVVSTGINRQANHGDYKGLFMPAIHSALVWSVKTSTLNWRFFRQQISWPAELRQQSCTIFLATQVSAAGRLQIISATCVKGATCSSRLKAYTPTLLTILMIRPFLDGFAQQANVQPCRALAAVR